MKKDLEVNRWLLYTAENLHASLNHLQVTAPKQCGRSVLEEHPSYNFLRLLRGISLRMTLGWERRMALKLLLKEGNNEVQVHVKLSVSGAHGLSPWAYSKATEIACFTMALRLSNPSKSVSSWRATCGKGMTEMCKDSQKRRDFSFKLQGQVRS